MGTAMPVGFGKIVTIISACMLLIAPVESRSDAKVKYSVVREENRKSGKETLILPYAFSSESMGTTFGVGGMVKGYIQDQLLIAGTFFGSGDDAKGFLGGIWDYRVPWTERFFVSLVGAVAYYPRQRAYTEFSDHRLTADTERAGTNDSEKEQFVQDDGQDNWYDLKLEYVLPLGSMQDTGMAEYHISRGILQSGATGGKEWNPLESGISVLLIGQKTRYQSYTIDDYTYDGDTFPFRVGYLYDNTDFPVNPSRGSTQYAGYIRDFSSDSDVGNWSFVEFETSKYIDLGPSQTALQRVLAFNFWTGTSPTWSESVDESGAEVIEGNPPFFEGAHLGGFYRMRGYPNNRFNDRSVIYSTAEYRHTLEWNPVQDVSWLSWLKLDWFQVVGFVEGGRVAGDYDEELLKDWKFDGGIGLRALTAGAVVRLDVAVSEEETTGWVMFGHPF